MKMATKVSAPGARRKDFFVPSLFALQSMIPTHAATNAKIPNMEPPMKHSLGFLAGSVRNLENTVH
jgi:hypothetical protein